MNKIKSLNSKLIIIVVCISIALIACLLFFNKSKVELKDDGSNITNDLKDTQYDIPDEEEIVQDESILNSKTIDIEIDEKSQKSVKTKVSKNKISGHTVVSNGSQ